MNSHQLAEILLKGENYPIVIRSLNGNLKAETIQNISILQHCDSPFEYAILLESNESIGLNEQVDIGSL